MDAVAVVVNLHILTGAITVICLALFYDSTDKCDLQHSVLALPELLTLIDSH